MTDAPRFIDEPNDHGVIIRSPARAAGRADSIPAPVLTDDSRSRGRVRSYIVTLDKPLITIVSILLAIGLLMVYSTTFFWSFVDFGSETAIFLRQLQFVGIGLMLVALLTLLDYRLIRRFAVWILLLSVSLLIAVLVFGDDTFGARRALIGGSLQPGEFAELAMVIYMAAWLGAKRTKVQSIVFGLIPFAMIVGFVGFLVMRQPDISTAVIIFVTTGIMFFLAGATIVQISIAAGVAGVLLIVVVQLFPYALDRVDTFVSSTNDLTQADYHSLQVLIAFQNGGWAGRGIGESLQKFQSLPASHTDSIFAVIGEELGLMGAGAVVLLYILFVVRGFMIANRAKDSFGALLASGVTVWVASKAMLNIAVMANVVPSTGISLPFISYGGSSMLVMLTGVGLLLSVSRVSRQVLPDRRKQGAHYDRRRWDGGTRLSRDSRRRSDGDATAGA